MSFVEYPLPVTPNGDGDDLSTVRAGGCRLVGVKVEMGTLTAMDVAITDEPTGTSLLALTAVAADGVYQPAAQLADPTDGTALTGAYGLPVAFGRIQVAIANGDAGEEGLITLLVER